MTMTDIIAIAVLLVIAAAAIRYIYKEKKRGVKCIGCPLAGSCCGHNQADSSADAYGSEGGGCCGCHSDEN